MVEQFLEYVGRYLFILCGDAGMRDILSRGASCGQKGSKDGKYLIPQSLWEKAKGHMVKHKGHVQKWLFSLVFALVK